MTIKNLLRPLPGVRQASLWRQRLGFVGSAEYWQRNYANGGTSGNGSYGQLAEAKAKVLNEFVKENSVISVIEFGCGDGHQLSLSAYEAYVGLDVSPAAIDLCKRRFADDRSKSFFLYDSARFVDRAQIFAADLSLSVDVIYHLVEDHVFEAHMTHLFNAAGRYVIIYSTNTHIEGTAPHVRHRKFTKWASDNCRSWELAQQIRGPNAGSGRADFFIYRRR